MGLSRVAARHGWHLAAVLWLALVVGLGLARRPSTEDLLARLEAGTAEQRMAALHALSQQAPWTLEPARIQALLDDPDARLGEFVFTTAISRHTGKQALVPLASARPDPAERWRARFWLSRDVASLERLTRAELKAYFATFASALPSESPPVSSEPHPVSSEPSSR